jgi:hypothetical protein
MTSELTTATHQKIVIRLRPNADVKMPLLKKVYIYSQFDTLADIILNRTHLVANQKTFRICECEFYYRGEGHDDAYTHCSSEQSMNCKIYFHQNRNGTYKAGTYKGLDITLSPRHDVYFGVLIRSIQCIDTGVIEGPCNTVNKILEQFNCVDVKKFMSDKETPLDVYDHKYGLYLVHSDPMDPLNLANHKQLYKGPRIGLSDKYPEFRDRHYRYVITPEHIKKRRNTLHPIVDESI